MSRVYPDSWGKEFELAFDGFEGQAASVGERPAEWALKPFRAVTLHATSDFRDADDAAGFKIFRPIRYSVAAAELQKNFFI